MWDKSLTLLTYEKISTKPCVSTLSFLLFQWIRVINPKPRLHTTSKTSLKRTIEERLLIRTELLYIPIKLS